jgi:hypothetical protein
MNAYLFYDTDTSRQHTEEERRILLKIRLFRASLKPVWRYLSPEKLEEAQSIINLGLAIEKSLVYQ